MFFPQGQFYHKAAIDEWINRVRVNLFHSYSVYIECLLTTRSVIYQAISIFLNFVYTYKTKYYIIGAYGTFCIIR
jgi:hypothetical protein